MVSTLFEKLQDSTTVFHSLDECERHQWDLNGFSQSGLDYSFLKTVEDSGINKLKHRYALIDDAEGETIGRANFYEVDMDFTTMDKKMTDGVKKSVKALYPDFMTFKVYEMGMFTMIGEALDVNKQEDTAFCLAQAAQHMQAYCEEENADFMLIRDVPYENLELYRKVLEPAGFYPALGFANASLPLRWECFDDYLMSLNSKDRHKLKTALKTEEKFGVQVEVINDYSTLSSELEYLWKKVNAKAKDYSREQLNEAYFIQSAKWLHENSEIIAFRYEGKLVAFMYNVFGSDDYTMLDWGVDYDFPLYSKVSLYRTASVLSIKRAFELGKSCFEMGITNYIPKKLLGATMEPLTYFVKHRDSDEYSKTLARLLTENIDLPEVLHANKTGEQTSFTDVDWIEMIRSMQDNCSPQDVFKIADREYKHSLLKMGKIYGFYPEFRSSQSSSIVNENGEDVVLIGTNSYLGLNSHPGVIKASVEATQKYGSGCSGSPLLNGTLDLHAKLEKELAAFVNKPSAVLCSTGYQTNLAALSALCNRDTLVLMDERNHRSLYDGVRLSGADIALFRHCDLAHAERILKRNVGRPCLWVTDSVFSMEGTVADLSTMCDLKEKYGCRLFVDESHAFGVLGETGRGVSELHNVVDRVDIVMGTFSKSLASLGGFIAASEDVVEFIKHKAGGHIFSASLPAGVVAAVRESLRLVDAEPERRVQLLEKSKYMADALKEMGYMAEYNNTPIVPVVFGDETLALAAYKKFFEEGVFVNPVIPPAVPDFQSGFRTSYMANHEWKDLDRALAVFKKLRPYLVDKTPLEGTDINENNAVGNNKNAHQVSA